MPEPDDHQLLAQFAREHSEPAFTALVQRHLNLVYSAARRHTGSDHAAEEITQAVFIILARKAVGLSPRIVLSGWLWQTVRLTAANHLRAESRRVRREQEAYMQSQINEPATDPAWQTIAPLLDDALDQLGGRDRDALVLRFFEHKNLREVGHALGASEDAAKMRVNRALEKLRKFFSRRGIVLSAALIAGAVSANSVQAAPAGLAKTISLLALTHGATAGTSTLTLVKGASKIMAWTKLKMAIAVGAGALLLAGTTLVTAVKVNQHRNDSWRNLAYFSSRPTLKADLDKTPPQATILPTIFPNYGSTLMSDNTGRLLGISSSVTSLVSYAYRVRETHMVFSEPMPGGKYDFIVNLPQGSAAAFQEKIKDQFGVVAHKDVVPTTVWVLTVGDPEKIKTLLSARERPVRDVSVAGQWKMQGATMADLANALEGLWLQAPVFDRTGLSQRYDFTVTWNIHDRAGRIPMITDELKQVGLELTPTNEPMEMLVVEKVK